MSEDRLAEEDTSVVLASKGMPEKTRTDCLRKLENWKSWTRSKRPHAVQLEPQEGEDDQVRVMPDRGGQKRGAGAKSTRSEILGDNPRARRDVSYICWDRVATCQESITS